MSRTPTSRRPRLKRATRYSASALLVVIVAVLTGASSAAVTVVVSPNVNVSGIVGSQAEGTIAVDPTNPSRVFAASNEAATPFWRSTDGGASWVIAGDGIGASCCDEAAAFDAFGNLFLVNINAALDAIVLYLSTDGGDSFSLLATIDTGGVDQPSLDAGAGSVWVTWNDGAIKARGAAVTGLGSVGAFSAEQTAPGTTGQFGDIAIGPAGQVVVTYQTDTQIFANTDADGLGAGGFGTQKNPSSTNVDTFDFIPAQDSRSIDAEANLAWDRSGGAHNGRLYLSYTDEPVNESNDTNVYVRFSDDNGATWSSRVRVNDDATATSQFLPSIAVDQTTGNVVLTWHDARADTVNNNLTRFWGALSSDGGATFAPNFQISVGQSNDDTAASPVDYGDYTTVDAFGGTLHAFWADNSDSTTDNPAGANSTFDMYTARVTIAPLTHAIITNPGCTATELPAVDDGSSPQLTLPFTINYFGNSFDSLYVNNNGNVTFNGPLGTFTPFPLLTTSTPIIAPFFADVDTTGGLPGGTTHYGDISAGETQIGGHPAFCVNWVDVGYYSANTNKLNSFQLVLINRSDTGAGNFDIMFNYDKVQWETGDLSGGTDGLGGNSARIGYSNGTTASFELAGSAVPGSFLDSNQATGLIHHNIGAPLQNGRYVFPVRNGAATGHSISGHIWANAVNTPASGAFIQACPTPADTPCRLTTSSPDGSYSLISLPDHTSGGGAVDHNWNLVVNPPAGSNLSGGTAGPIAVNGSDVTGQDVILHGPTPLPAGASITTPSGTQSSGTPSVYWGDPMTVRFQGCSPGTGTATLLVSDGYTQTVALVPAGPGAYTATFAAPFPHHGNASISWTISCGSTGGFDLYIDPSGVVKTVGGAPLSGATVTLFRSDDAGGPFTQVPDGSAIMSPSNRTNPDTTDVTGHFGWDVLAGFYKVRAARNGCTAPGTGLAFVESGVLTIPPPVTDLDLRLNCGADFGPPSNLTATALSRSEIGLAWTDNALTETGFKIERSPDGSTGWRQIGTEAADTTTYTHARQPPLTTYFYRVRATNGAADTAYSNIATATTLDW